MSKPDVKFLAAKVFVMPFGKYKGRTLDEIAKSDEGLRYLDWADGEWENPPEQILTYCADPSIAAEIERMLEE